MKMRVNCIFAALFVISLLGCRDKSTLSEATSVKYDTYQSVMLSAGDYFSDITVVPLETNDQCVIGSVQRVELIDSAVVIGSDDNIFIFNTSGKFVARVGRQGRGAGEYLSHRGFFVSGNNIIVLDPNNGKLNRYDFAGKFCGSEELPSGLFAWGYSGMSVGEDNTLILNQLNPAHSSAYTAMDLNDIEKSHNLELSYEPLKLDFAYGFSNHPMTRSGDKIHMTMPLDNTVYEFSDGKILPKYSINTPGEIITKDNLQQEIRRTRSYLGAMSDLIELGGFGGFTDIFETDNYVFLHYWAKSATPGLFIFDKRASTGNYFTYPQAHEYIASPIFPVSACGDNRLLSVVSQAHELGAAFSIPQQLKAYVEAVEISESEISAPLRTMLGAITEEGNPFLVFYTVK